MSSKYYFKTFIAKHFDLVHLKMLLLIDLFIEGKTETVMQTIAVIR